VLGTVRGNREDQAFFADRIGKFADQVSFRAHFNRSPIRVTAIVHGKAVMMFGDRHDKAGSGFTE
jgi:hypothetical protein